MTNLARDGRYTGPSFQTAQETLKKPLTPFKAPQATPVATTRELSNGEAKNALALDDLRNAGGVMAYGDWSTGSGNYKKRRDTPTGATVWANWDNRAPAGVIEWFLHHPRARRCIALDNL